MAGGVRVEGLLRHHALDVVAELQALDVGLLGAHLVPGEGVGDVEVHGSRSLGGAAHHVVDARDHGALEER